MLSQHISLLECAWHGVHVTNPSLMPHWFQSHSIPKIRGRFSERNMRSPLLWWLPFSNQVKLKKIQKEVHLSSISQQNYIYVFFGGCYYNAFHLFWDHSGSEFGTPNWAPNAPTTGRPPVKKLQTLATHKVSATVLQSWLSFTGWTCSRILANHGE